MLAHCTETFQSILLTFQVKLLTKQQEAIQLQFHQSYVIKGTQNLHYFHPTRPTQIKMKGICLVSTYSLVMQTSSNYQLKPTCLKGNYVAAVYDKALYTGI